MDAKYQRSTRFLSTYFLEYARHLGQLRLHRRRRRLACAPTSNIANHDNHEKINSWVSFSFLYEYGAPQLRYTFLQRVQKTLKPHTIHYSSIRSDEELTLETSPFESLYHGKFTLSIQLIKTNYLSCYTSHLDITCVNKL